MANYTIKGNITGLNNTPLSNLTIRAYDMDLRRRELLGETTTDHKGAYQLHYTAQQFARAEKGAADILVEVWSLDNQLVGQSDIQFNAKEETTVDLSISPEKYTPPTEFDDIATTIAPLLEGSGITLAEVEEDATHSDLTFIVGETSLDRTKLIGFLLGHRLAAKSDLAAEVWYATLLYQAILHLNTDVTSRENREGALAQQTESILATLPSVDMEDVRSALEKAVASNRIKADISIEDAVIAFKKLAVLQANRLDTAVKSLLVIANVGEGKHADFASLFLENRAFDADFKQKIKTDKRFTQKEKNDLATTARLAELTGHHAPTMQKLKDIVGVHGENGIRQLARKSAAEWEKLLADTSERNILERDSTHDFTKLGAMPTTVSSIASSFAAAYPTAAFAGALSRDVAATKRKQSRQVAQTDRAVTVEKEQLVLDTPLPIVSESAISILPTVSAFLNKNSSLDLLEHNIDTYFEQNTPNEATQTRTLLAQEDTTELKNALKTVQRVFRLQPSFEATKSLLENDLHSSQKIYSMGEQAFVNTMQDAAGFSERTARATFQKAANTHAAVLTMVADWRDAHEAQNIAALQTPSVSATVSNERALLPNLQTLFGSLDVCECEHCRSVFSPSAYLMDTITFLKNRKSITLGQSAWAVLKKRRPDIGFLEMSCDNTNVPLPYIDIVCEVLEEEAAFMNPVLSFNEAAWAFRLPLSSEANLTKGLASLALKVDFSTNNIVLTDKAVVSEKRTLTDRSTYDCWIVRDTKASFKVVKRVNDLAIALLRQTRGTEAWLAATPQYVNQKVYFPDGLSSAVYPMNLPFNLFLEETRALMSHADVQRWELMETMRGSSANVNTATEYFELSVPVLNATPDTKFKFWGEVNNSTLVANCSKVNTFLQKTGLEYADMLRLLDLKWVNPTGSIFVEHLDTSCDTDKKVIQKTDPSVFDRILKLIRLSRLAGWALWETDLILRHPKLGNGVLTENTLVQIWIFADLTKQLHLSVEQALVLLGDMNTETRFSEAYAPRIEGLYQTLFLNIRNVPPTAFDLAKVTSAAPIALIADNKKALQTVLQLKEAELEILLNLKRPDGSAFLAANAPLNLTNISFLYRNILLYRAFNMSSVSDWATFLRFMNYIALDNTASALPFTWLSRESTAVVNQAVTFYNAHFFDMPELEYMGKDDRTSTTAPKESVALTFLSNLIEKTKILHEEAIGKIKVLRDENPIVVGENPALRAKINALISNIDTSNEKNKRTFIVQQFSEQLDVSLSLTESILADVWFGTVKGGAILPFLDTTQVLPITTGNFANGFNSYHWLHRVALLIQKFDMNLTEVQAINDLQAQDSLFAHLVFAPLAQTITLQTLSEFKKILDFNRYYNTEKFNFFAIQTKLKANTYANVAAFAQDTASLFNSKVADIEFLVQEWSPVSPFPSGYVLNVAAWQRLEKTLIFAQKLNVSTAQLKTLSDSVGNYVEQSALLRQSLRPAYSEKQWLDLLKTIRDDLRERRREALVAFILTQTPPHNVPSGKWENANDLYAYYLMDVEMTSAQPTSRIVQAAGSIQLFVQRCFMGLEPEIIVDTEGANADMGWLEWSWMKNYRVWEANRKVFLYPENWIEPELRRNKSPFFKELENELAQNELTKENVETVFLNYLEKLESVAQLEPMGHCWQEETNTFHVFARTASIPHTYYYRQFQESRRWTAWEKVELDIQNDYLVPFVRNGQLYLFWGQILEILPESGNNTVIIPTQANSNEATPYTMQTPKKQMNLQLAYSQLKNGIWTPKKVSKNSINLGVYPKDKNNILSSKDLILVPLTSDDLTHYVKEDASSVLVVCYKANAGEQKFQGEYGFFKIDGCKGIPEAFTTTQTTVLSKFPIAMRTRYENMKAVETSIDRLDYFSLKSNGEVLKLLDKTGEGAFEVSESWQPTIIDEIAIFLQNNRFIELKISTSVPYFFRDFQRTFWVSEKYINPENNDIFGLIPLADWVRFYLENSRKLKQLQEDLAANRISQARYDVVKAALSNQFNKYLSDHSSFFNAVLTTKPRTFFYTFYHPLICLFANKIYNEGIKGLMKRSTQLADKKFEFKDTYLPTVNVGTPYPRENVDFTPDGSYSLYNWELFFHAPLTLATRLAKDQKFEEAINWFHYIFNPLDPTPLDLANPASKYWVTKPFFERQKKEYNYQRIDTLLKKLAGDPSVPADDTTIAPPFTKQEIENQVTDWRKHPFEPHTIAEYRTVAYQKTVVMKYLDTIIAWGDQLYRRDTMEYVNEATQLYIIAAEILGTRPRRVPPQYKALPETFHELEAKMDTFSNSLVTGLENLVSAVPATPTIGATPTLPNVLYFCLPQNDKLLNYWDTVENRLFSIRHGLNIEGVKRSLALFAPPIDPAALVRAVAGGADIGSALADINSPMPLYRFQVALQKANELCSDVKGLGSALLSVLEKKDGEILSLLRQTHEIAVLESMRSIKVSQIEDAKLALDGLKKSKELIEIRRDYTLGLHAEDLNTGEHFALGLHNDSKFIEKTIAQGHALAGMLALIPGNTFGVSGLGSPVATLKLGGHDFANAVNYAMKTASAFAQLYDKEANLSNTLASYTRRREEWAQQIKSADKELEQIEKSLTAAELKISIAERELKNHDLQVKNAHSIDEFMRTKYTNRELYEWQLSQITLIYFQTYQLAYDWAKKAEKCWRFELGIAEATPSVIQFGHWDSLKKGLLSGEKLQLDLRRLEAAYMETNKREFELTKHISLALINPMAILRLRETGSCQFDLPEEIFDLDYQGHYFRRIKTVSLSMPCIAGPYTTINATLRLINNSLRFDKTTTPQYARSTNGDTRFMENPVGVKNVALSSAQNDNGLFDFNFRDERYLPFEGAGVISTWVLELSTERSLRQFDYNTISDAILHIRYTAREDAVLKTKSTDYLKTLVNMSNNTPFRRLFSLRHDFPTAWHHFLNPAAGQENICSLDMVQDRFPFFAQGKKITIKSAEFHIKAPSTDVFDMQFMSQPTAPPVLTSAKAIATTGLQAVTIAQTLSLANAQNPASFWQLKLKKHVIASFNALKENDVEDVFLLVEYVLQ